jgi:hypothetical protein
MHDDVYVGRLLSGKYVGFLIARVPSASFNVLEFLQSPQINHRKKKKNLMLVRLPSVIAFVLSCRAWTATCLLRRLLGTLNYLCQDVRAQIPILTHLHPSFGHEHAMRVCQASLLLPSVISPAYRAFWWVRGVQDPLKTALVPKP